ncbi:serine hydrolase [Myxococcus sp. AM010]|uniref:serine hydrolase domain-containing protein n=1 Tax=Myxococcus sp. AM010 TaxID=2745138 RepID=UPI0015956522|nr:serine hydrolase domain-containing protein [Myxococcus sp. AM010]NVJ15727.1 beta-lactamase family protein [Myxococcus sp. AM010]
MRYLLFLPLCTLLACAHSQPAATPPAPAAQAPVDPESRFREALQRAGRAMEVGRFDSALAEMQRLWDGGHQTDDVAWYAAYASLGTGDDAAAFTWLERSVERGMSSPGDLLHDKSLAPLRRMPGYDALVARARENALKARAEGNVGAGLEKTTPAEAGVSVPALEAFVKAAEDAGSSALVVLRHGKLVGEWYFGGETQRIESMSATKGVVALAIGLLIDEGRIASADAPVSTFFPEWKDGLKGKVTLRHLLSHTSGLAANASAMDIYESRDFVRYALDAHVVDVPGSQFFYNNKATNLLAGVVERASGEKLDAYLMRRLFEPLGIRDVFWQKDPSGNPLGMSGLRLHPVDFAKVGQLMLQRGVWQGQRILSESWVQECTAAPSQAHNPTAGLLWWLVYDKAFRVLGQDMVDEARRNGMPEAPLSRLRDVVDQPIPSGDFVRVLSERLGGMKGVMAFMEKSARVPLRTQVEGAPQGYSARGSFGQVLLVVPAQDLVVVRMAVPDGRVPPDVMEFPAFNAMALSLVPSP